MNRSTFLARVGWSPEQLRAAHALGFPNLVTLRVPTGLGPIDFDVVQYVTREAADEWLRDFNRLTATAAVEAGTPIHFSLRASSNRMTVETVLYAFGWSREQHAQAQELYRFPAVSYMEGYTPDGLLQRTSVLRAHELDEWLDKVRALVPTFAMQQPAPAAGVKARDADGIRNS
jgi:hypothetical protein